MQEWIAFRHQASSAVTGYIMWVGLYIVFGFLMIYYQRNNIGNKKAF